MWSQTLAHCPAHFKLQTVGFLNLFHQTLWMVSVFAIWLVSLRFYWSFSPMSGELLDPARHRHRFLHRVTWRQCSESPSPSQWPNSPWSVQSPRHLGHASHATRAIAGTSRFGCLGRKHLEWKMVVRCLLMKHLEWKMLTSMDINSIIRCLLYNGL